jgi:hypothetical protein
MSRLLSAAKRHYEAKRDEAIANLEVCFTKAVGRTGNVDLATIIFMFGFVTMMVLDVACL